MELVTRDFDLEKRLSTPREQFPDREPTEAEYDELVRRGKATSLLARKKKHADCASIVGKDHCDLLEDEDLKMSGLIKTRAAEVDPGALVVRGYFDDWPHNNSHGWKKMGVDDRRADVWYSAVGPGVELQLQNAEGKRFTASDGPLGYLSMADAVDIATRWLAGEDRGFIALEDTQAILRSWGQTSGGNMDNTFPIPQAEYSNPKSDHNVTPNLRSMIQRTTGLTPTPNPAPVVERSRLSPAMVGPSMAQIQQAVQMAIAPIAADLTALKARNASVARTAPRRAVAPQVSVNQIRALQGLDPLTVRTVASHAYGGLPTRRRVFSPREVARRSYGLSLTERSAETRPSVFRSRYQAEAQFSSAAARDLHDASFQQPAGVISPGTPARLSALI